MANSLGATVLHQDKSAEAELRPIRTEKTNTTSKRIPRSIERVAAGADNNVTSPEVKNGAGANPHDLDGLLPFLRSQPETSSLIEVLKKLSSHTPFPGSNFTIFKYSPLQSQVVNVIVREIVPAYWWVLKDSAERKYLTDCLSSVIGISTIFSHANYLSSQAETSKTDIVDVQHLHDLFNIASDILEGSEAISHTWHILQQSQSNAVQVQALWKEFIALVGSGKAISIASRANKLIDDHGLSGRCPTWLIDGAQYSQWLGSNLAHSAMQGNSSIAPTAQLFIKSLSLGYQGSLIAGLFRAGFVDAPDVAESTKCLKHLFSALPLHARQKYLEHVCRWLSTIKEPMYSDLWNQDNEERHSGIEALAKVICISHDEEDSARQIISLLADPQISSTVSHDVRRALVPVASRSQPEQLDDLFTRLVRIFGDTLFIAHAPIKQQETIAQSLLTIAASCHRRDPNSLLRVLRTSPYLQAVSNRLDSSNSRARWLGMIVGTALSGLVDQDGSKMKFGTDDMDTKEALWYYALVKVDDGVGNLDSAKTWLTSKLKVAQPRQSSAAKIPAGAQTMPILNGKPVFGPVRPPESAIIKRSDTSDDAQILGVQNGLRKYAKPDSDAEDSEDDATLVHRKKFKAPVYIRDLMSMLRDDQNAERFQLGVKHAAGLIRRKANHGTEVRDHIEELGSILCNLQDPFSTENFSEARLQALVAVLVSDVRTMAPWLSRQAFTGDHSIAQRCIMLSALGIGGRELAGMQEDLKYNPSIPDTQFPSKMLPPRLHAIYGGMDISNETSTTHLEAAADSTQRMLLQPMAMKSADQTTAHLDAVKVRRFSERPQGQQRISRTTKNGLAKVFSEFFFFPLASCYQQNITAQGHASVFAGSSFVLVTFIKTLALLVHAAGPAMLDLPTITTEMWDLLLSLRTRAGQDIAVMQAVLFANLTLLEVNTDLSRIARENSRQLLATQQWVDMVFERMGTLGDGIGSKDDDRDETKVRTLAAAVLVKGKEIIDKHQRELIGFSIN